MGLFDRRPHHVAPKRRTFDCSYSGCGFADTDPEVTFGHMLDKHSERRCRFVSPHPSRRSEDGMSPAVQRFRAAAARGEGLGRRAN